MELSQQSVHDVIHPTAAFTEFDARNSVEPSGAIGEVPWSESSLNPATRINSLGTSQRASVADRRVYFLRQPILRYASFCGILFRPYRVDVFIPEPSKLDAELREVLDVDVVLSYKRCGPHPAAWAHSPPPSDAEPLGVKDG